MNSFLEKTSNSNMSFFYQICNFPPKLNHVPMLNILLIKSLLIECIARWELAGERHLCLELPIKDYFHCRCYGYGSSTTISSTNSSMTMGSEGGMSNMLNPEVIRYIALIESDSIFTKHFSQSVSQSLKLISSVHVVLLAQNKTWLSTWNALQASQ